MFGFFVWDPIGWIAAGITAWICYFLPRPRPRNAIARGLVISPADGRVSLIEKVRPPMELGLGDEERVRISVFLSVFDVHINRAPVAGRIKRSVYIPGAYLNAALDKASEDNERRAIVIGRRPARTSASCRLPASSPAES